ncbi:MAG: hypothetical protein FJ242_10605 [Nitrospira sp.]|nr:hypothetical protein [Nitrospira sp.]
MPTIPTKLDVTGVKNKIMIFFYKNLENNNRTEMETTNPIQESIFSKVANDWRRYEQDVVQTLPVATTSLTTFTDPLKESCSLLFTEKILEFCSKHNIYRECCVYYTLFLENFKHIQNVDISISEDPEIPNYQKVCFVLTIADSIENILRYEDEVRKKIRKEIQKEKRQNFIYNYNLI